MSLATSSPMVAAGRRSILPAARGPLVLAPHHFWPGVAGLLGFGVVLALWLLPVVGARSGVQLADDLFNQLAKQSAAFAPQAEARAASWEGTRVDIEVDARWPDAGEVVATLVAGSGGSAERRGGGKVRVTGDLGRLARRASLDAAALFEGREADLNTRYGVAPKAVVYAWWTVFDGLSRRFTQAGRPAEADHARYMTTRVLEPAYNFAGIAPRGLTQVAGPALGLLAFYLAYTLWYGVSVLLVFEGLGIRAAGGAKREA